MKYSILTFIYFLVFSSSLLAQTSSEQLTGEWNISVRKKNLSQKEKDLIKEEVKDFKFVFKKNNAVTYHRKGQQLSGTYSQNDTRVDIQLAGKRKSIGFIDGWKIVIKGGGESLVFVKKGKEDTASAKARIENFNVSRITFSKDNLMRAVEIDLYRNLREVTIYFDSILTSIPSEFWKLKTIKKLILINISEIPKEIYQLKKLTHLTIGTQKEIMNAKVFRCPASLESLNLSLVKINSNLFEFFNSPNLNELVITSDSLKNLPQAIGKLTSLKKLELKTKSLETIPAELYQLTNLVSLQISSNRLKSILPEISNLKQLEFFELISHKNKIHLADAIFNLPSLKQFYLLTPCANLPATVINLNSLEIFELENNSATNLPKNFQLCNNLKTLRLNLPELKKIPNSFSDLKKITALTLNNVKGKMPVLNFGSESLKKISVYPARNEKVLSSEISGFPNLTFLRLTGITLDFNHIESNTSIESLFLNNVELTTIPKKLLDFKQLKYVNLQNNKIEVLPSYFNQFTALQNFDLTMNPIGKNKPNRAKFEAKVDF